MHNISILLPFYLTNDVSSDCQPFNVRRVSIQNSGRWPGMSLCSLQIQLKRPIEQRIQLTNERLAQGCRGTVMNPEFRWFVSSLTILIGWVATRCRQLLAIGEQLNRKAALAL